MSWFIERRLDYIDWCLAYNGGVRRGDIVMVFGISVPQASGDLQEFLSLYPNAMRYDATEKRYVAVKTRGHYRARRAAPSGFNWN